MWRSLLFVPVLNDRLVEGAARRGADAVVLDLEAAVSPDRKEEARAELPRATSALKAAGITIAVRVNALNAGGAEDIAVAIEAATDLIVLPQASSTSAKQASDLAGATPLIPLIESPRGVIEALAIAEVTSTIVGLGLGVEDYATEMGAQPTPDLLVPAAFQVIQAARAARIEPLVIPDTIADYTDVGRFETAARKAKALGASGSFAIHPKQVAVSNDVFMPSIEEVGEAQDIIAMAEQAHQNGDSIASFNGHMIDAPIVDRARAVVARWKRFGDRSKPSSQI